MESVPFKSISSILLVLVITSFLLIAEKEIYKDWEIGRKILFLRKGKKEAKFADINAETSFFFPCEERDPQIIVYNRIPKTGSTTMVALLNKLALRNNFHVIFPRPFYSHSAVRKAIADAISSGQQIMICNHFNFPEIKYGTKLAYINILRSPVNRCFSGYYYSRYGDRDTDLKATYVAEYGKSRF